MFIYLVTNRHKGCVCNDGFEGEFCEYIEGQAPTVSLAGLFFLLIAVFVSLTVISGGFIIRKIRTKKASKAIETATSGSKVVNADVKVRTSNVEMT